MRTWTWAVRRRANHRLDSCLRVGNDELGRYRHMMGDKCITVAFRYDDLSQRSDTATESAVVDVLQRFGLPCLLGVIPFHGGSALCKNDKTRWLRDIAQSPKFELGLHGLRHEKEGRRGEFWGLSLRENLRRLTEARVHFTEMLERPTDIFIPPWNDYDAATVTALEELGFSTLSASLVRKPEPPSSSLCYIPGTCAPDELKAAIDAARRWQVHSALIVVVMHSFHFAESGKAKARLPLDQFRAQLEWLDQQKDVTTSTFQSLRASDPSLSLVRKRGHGARFPVRLLPPRLRDRPLRLVYLDCRSAARFHRRIWTRVAAIYIGLVCLTGISALILGRLVYP